MGERKRMINAAEARTKQEAEYMLENKASVRETAKHFGACKSTVHYHLTQHLPRFDKSTYVEVRKMLEFNRKNGPKKGGEIIRQRYAELRKKRRIAV